MMTERELSLRQQLIDLREEHQELARRFADALERLRGATEDANRWQKHYEALSAATWKATIAPDPRPVSSKRRRKGAAA